MRGSRGLRPFFVLWAMVGAGGAMAQTWVTQISNTKADLRGISAFNSDVAWAGGTKGTFLRTVDGGATWIPGVVAGAGDADFRAVHAFSDKSAYLMSAGTGPLSRLYRTDDSGVAWRLVKVNAAAQGFWDDLAMWDPMHGILLGDPVDGRFVVWTTSDGLNWNEQKGPQATKNEAVFAASNSSLIVRGAHEAWFGAGGPAGARVFHSDDGGKSWTAVKTPVRHDAETAGIYSLGFSSARHGVAVGGDFMKPSEASAAITDDGGKTWASPAKPPGGYRSAVTYLAGAKLWIAVGPSGSDVSRDDGQTWTQFDKAPYNAMSFSPDGDGWAAGPAGAIASYHER